MFVLAMPKSNTITNSVLLRMISKKGRNKLVVNGYNDSTIVSYCILINSNMDGWMKCCCSLFPQENLLFQLLVMTICLRLSIYIYIYKVIKT